MAKEKVELESGIKVVVSPHSYIRYPHGRGGQSYHAGDVFRMSKEDFARYEQPGLNWGGGGVPVKRS